MGRQGLVQARNVISVQHGAGRIIGIGQKNHFGFIAERGQQAIDTGRQIFFRHFDRRGTGGAAGQLVNQKSMHRVQHFIARPQIGFCQKAQNIIRAIAANNTRRIQPIDLGQFLAQSARAAIGIKRRVAQIFERSQRFRAGPERVFIGGKLERVGNAVDRFLAANIGRHIQYAVFCYRSGHFSVSETVSSRVR